MRLRRAAAAGVTLEARVCYPEARMKRLAVVASAVFLAGCGLFPKEEKVLAPPLITPPEVVYDTVAVTRGSIENRVTVLATFTPVDQQVLSFRSRSGRLKSLHVKLGDDVKAGALVAELDTGSLENRIARLKILLRKAELASERAVALNRDRFERESAALDVELARLELADAQNELEQSRLYAPAAGTVVYVAQVREGDVVSAYQTLVQTADPRKLQLIYKGDKASEFRVGMRVTVVAHGKEYRGEVVMAPGTTPYDAPEDLKSAIMVALERMPADVGRGDTASVSIVLARRDNVIVIPQDLVHRYLGRTYVQVMKNGVKSERTVELGLQTVTEVEVVKGLSVGEQIVSR